MAAEVLGQAQNAANIAKRVPQMLAEIAEAGMMDYYKEAVARAATLSGWSSAIVSSTNQLEAALDKFLEDGNLQAFLMQADAVLNEVLALRIELSGLVGPGDSISMTGLIMAPGVTQDTLVGGVKVGPKDAAKGVTPKRAAGPEAAVGGTRVLPTALHSFSGDAIRAQGPQYMQYADGLRAAIRALR